LTGAVLPCLYVPSCFFPGGGRAHLKTPTELEWRSGDGGSRVHIPHLALLDDRSIHEC